MRVFKHPEQMTPGSCWKVKGMKGLRYLEGDYKVGCNFRGWHRRATWNPQTGHFAVDPMPELDFELDTIYMLTEFNMSEDGWIVARFIGPEKIVWIDMYETYWDRSFRLAKRTRYPKKVNRLIFGKYDVDELKKKLGME